MPAKNSSNQIIIKAVGDICPGDKTIMGLGVMGKTPGDRPCFPLEFVSKHLKESDIFLANFEGLLTEMVVANSKTNLTFCGLPAFADCLASFGETVLNVANNHILEHGEKIFHETLGHLRKAGIHVCGLRSNDPKFYSEPVILRVKGKKIGIIGYNWVGIDKFPEADKYISQSRDSLVNYTWDRFPDKEDYHYDECKNKNLHLQNDVTELKKEVDTIILMAHWGFEYVHHPPYNLTLEARTFLDKGVDLILGSHPHVLQGEEIIDQKIVFYSLGNFIFDMVPAKTRYTALLEISLGNEIKYNYLPFYINNKFQPQPPSKGQSNKIFSILKNSNHKITSEERKDILQDTIIYREYERFYNKMKFKTILYHFVVLIDDFSVILLIISKIGNMLSLISKRLRGEKIRW